MLKKILATGLIFYILSIAQSSFLWFFPNLILIFALAIFLFEKEKYEASVPAALSGGFLWDIFSGTFFGYHVIFLLSLAIFIRLIIRKYVNVRPS